MIYRIPDWIRSWWNQLFRRPSPPPPPRIHEMEERYRPREDP